LSGLLVIEPSVHADERGFFLEAYGREQYLSAGVTTDFVQDNHSRSRRGTIRGLHYQRHPGQAKLVRVARGQVWDVVVDIRLSSPTFGEYEAFELDDRSHRQLFIPVGFAHGFCVISDVADVIYKVSSRYDSDEERGIAWSDPAIGIPWPAERPIVSDRDDANPTLASALPELSTLGPP
jgi:dTDP-4-dehydrorhamnose 3,5-epimerase